MFSRRQILPLFPMWPLAGVAVAQELIKVPEDVQNVIDTRAQSYELKPDKKYVIRLNFGDTSIRNAADLAQSKYISDVMDSFKQRFTELGIDVIVIAGDIDIFELECPSSSE